MKLSGVYVGERQHHGFSLHQQRKKGQRLWYFWLDKKITKPYFYNLTTIPTKNQGVKCTTKRYFFVRIHETRLLETQKVRICMIFELSKNAKLSASHGQPYLDVKKLFFGMKTVGYCLSCTENEKAHSCVRILCNCRICSKNAINFPEKSGIISEGIRIQY